MADDCIQYFIKYDVIQKSAVVSQSYAKAILVILFAVKLRSTTCDEAYGNAFVNRLDCYFIFS